MAGDALRAQFCAGFMAHIAGSSRVSAGEPKFVFMILYYLQPLRPSEHCMAFFAFTSQPITMYISVTVRAFFADFVKYQTEVT